MPNFSTKQLKVDKPVLHIDDEFQTTKIKDNSIAISSISQEVKSNNPEAIYSIQKTKDRRLILSFDLKNASGTTSIQNEGRLSMDNATAVNSWVLDSQINQNVYRLTKTGPNYITVGSGENTNIKTLRRFINRRFTIIMWIKFHNTGAAEDIFSFKGSNTGTQHLSLIKTSGNMLKLSSNTNNLTTSLSRPTSWNHIAITYSFKNNLRKIFINGKKASVSRSGSRLDLSGAVECFIGRANLDTTNYANADIYGFKIYKRSIRNNEIRRIYELSSLSLKIEISDLSSALQIFYKMNDSGSTLKDTSSNTNDSTSITGTDIVTSPFGGVCRSFDGIDDVVILPNIRSVFHNTDFTVAFWVNIHTLPSGGDNTRFFFESKNGSISASSSTNQHLLIGVTTSNKLRFGFWNNSIHSNSNITANTWYHVTCVCVDGSSRTIYINGDNDNQESQTEQLTMNSADGVITIGRRTGAGVSDFQFTHFSMLNFRIFSNALNEIEIKALYNNDRHKKIKSGKIQGVGPAEKRVFVSKSGNVDINGKFITKPLLTASDNLIFHLQFSETDMYDGGVKAYDSGGRYTFGTLNGFTTSNKHDPDFPNSLDFTGTNPYILFNDSDFLDFKSRIAKSELTITFWVNFNIESTGDKPIIFISDSASPGNYRAIIIHGTSTTQSNNGNYTKLNFELKGSDLISSKELLSNNWYHCACTYNPEGTNRRKMYINGVLDTSRTHSNANVRLHTFTGGALEIGRNPLDTPTYFGAGKLADLRIYNRELNGDEIGKIYFETSRNVDYSPYKLSLLNPSPIHSPGLMLQFRAENTGNSSATDRSGNNHHASASSNLFDTTTLITTNKSFKFDSADKDYLVLDGFTTGKGFSGVCGSSPRSITFWTKITNTSTERPVIGYGDRSFYITIDEYEKVRIYSGSNKYLVFSPALSTTEKQHITVVIDQLNSVNTLIDSSKLFINGTRAYISGRSSGDAFTSFGDGTTNNTKRIEVNDGNTMKTVFHQTDFSISFWVRFNELDGYARGIFESRNTSSSTTNAYLRIRVSNSSLNLSFWGDTTLNIKTTVDGSTNWAPTLDTWYHLVFTVEAGGDKKIYKDGNYNTFNSANQLTMNGSTGYVRFGIWSSYPASIQDMDLADFRIYNKVLSAAEVSQIYQLDKNNYRDDITGLIHQWPFDGDQGVRNIMSPTHYGVPNNLTITPQNFDVNTEIDTSNENNVEIGRRGVFYTSFDGTDDVISVPVAVKDVFHNSSFSISFWFRPLGVSASAEGIFEARNTSGSTTSQWLYIEYKTNYFRFGFYNNDLDISNFSPVSNVWYYITCVFEIGVGKKIYINGSLNNSNNGLTALTMNSTAGTGYVNIGKFSYSNRYGNSDLSDFRIYSKAISSREITQLYKAGKCSFDNNLVSNLAYHWKLNETFKYKSDNTVRHRSFDGTDDYISLPLEVKDTFHNASFSLSFWFRPQSLSSTYKGLFEARNTSSSVNNAYLIVRYRNDTIQLSFYGNDLYSSYSFSNYIWYYVSLVFDTSGGKRIYINGSLNDSNSQTTSLTMNSTAGTGYVNIGKYTLQNAYSIMDLSDFRIYSKALSANEVSAIYSGGIYSFTNTYNGGAISNLVYHYKLDSSTNLNDSGSNSANGTNQGTTSILDTDIRHRSFDGTDDYISLPLEVKYTFSSTFSISFWWRPQSVSATWRAIFEARNTSSSTTNQWLHIVYYNNQIWYSFSSSYLQTSGFSPVSNTWYHVVCNFDASVGKKIYVNGVLNNSNSDTTVPILSTAGTGYVNIGKQSNGRYGKMDLSDFRIYSKTLSASEVSNIYNAGKYSFSNTYDGTTISNLQQQYRLDKDLNNSVIDDFHGTNQGTTSSVDNDIHYKNEKSDVFHGITHTLTENTYDYFDGYLDDIRIYNKAITEDQVKRIYNGGTGGYTNETIQNLQLKINPKDKTHQYDNYNHRSFDGVDDYIYLSLSVKNVFHNTSFSISFWWRPQSVSATWRGIFEARNTSSSTNNQWLYLQYYSNQIQFGFYGNNLSTTNFYPVSNVWYYITCVFETGVGKKIYINGVLNISHGTTTTLTLNSDAGYVNLGLFSDSNRYGKMDLSDFRIYSKALSASEVFTIHSAGLYNFSNSISNLEYQYRLDSADNVNDSGSNSARGTNVGSTVGNKKYVSSIVLNDTSGSGLSNNMTLSDSNMLVGEKIVFNGVNEYASTENISNSSKTSFVLKNKPEMTHESVIAGSKASGSSLADGDFQIKVKPCGYSNHTRNLIAQYTFFEGAGTIVYDTAAKTKAWATENRLNLYNSPTWNSTGGPFGEPCLSFDGSNDKVLDNTNGSSKPLWRDEVRLHNSPTAFSVSVWFYADGAAAQDYILDIGILVLNWKHSSDTTYSQSFFGRQSGGYAIAKLYTGGTPNLAEDTWYHATATWEWSSGSNGVLKAYLNGELISTASSEEALTNGLKNLWVGVGNNYVSNYFAGRVSNLQFFNSTLSSGEVKEIYDTAHLAYENYSRNRMCMIPHFEDRLLAHYKCDEGSGTILHDSSIYKRHGTIRSASWSTHEQFSDLNVLSFDGTNDFVEDIPNFENELNTEYSITCWVKPVYTSNVGVVFSTVHSTNNGFNLFAPYTGSFNNVSFRVRDNIAHDDNRDCELFTQKTSIKSGDWFHLAATVSTKHIALYVNGVSNNDMGTGYTDVSQAGQDTWQYKGLVGGNSGKLVNSLAPGFKIGVEVYNNFYQYYYQGKLSDLRIYKGTFTGEEVRQIYRSDYYKYSVDVKINSKIYNIECDKMLSINQYHNLALVYASGVEAKLYLDNYQVARLTLPSSQSLNTSNSITVGAQDLNGVRNLWFEGSITEFRVYNKKLTNKEIQELGYENERCQLRIQGYESKASGLANASLINLGHDSTTKITMNGFDTTQGAITTSMPDGVIGKNIVFNGSDEYLSIDTNSKLSNETQKNFTITGWIKPSSSDSGTNNPIIAKYGSTDPSKYYKINYDDTNGELDFTVTSSLKAAYFDGGDDYIAVPRWDNIKEPWSITFWYLLRAGSSRIVFSTRSRIGDKGWNIEVNQGDYHRFGVNSREHNNWAMSSNYNTITSTDGRKDWYHIAFTSVTGRQNMYVDGKLTKSSSYNPFRTWTHTATQHEVFYIGLNYGAGQDFLGYLSDLRIYSQELNIEDISRIFKEGLGGYGGNINMNLELRYKFDNPSNLAEDSSGNRRDGSVQANTTVKMDSYTTQDHTITTKVNTDTWSHFALVADSETRIMTVYINGIKVAQQEIGNINNDNPEEINIGGDGTNFFTGAVCDIRIYDTALKGEVVKTLLYEGYGSEFKKLDNIDNNQSNEPSLPKGLKIHYNGSTTGYELLDVSGNKNNALLLGSPTITTSGKYNSGIVFDNTEKGGNWTFDFSTDTWTTSIAHGLNVNDAIMFTTDGGGATGYDTLITYYVISAPSANTLQLSTIINGTYTNGTQNSSGNWKAIKPQLGQIRSGSVREYLKDNFSISTWVKFANDGNNPPVLLQEDSAIFGVYSKLTATGSNSNLMLYKKYVDGQHEIHFTFYGSDFSARINPSTDWIHISATYGITHLNKNLICNIPLDENYSGFYQDKETKRLHTFTGGPTFITDDPNFSSCYSFDGTDDGLTLHESTMRQVNKSLGSGNSSNPCEITIMLWMQVQIDPGDGNRKVFRFSNGNLNLNWENGNESMRNAFELNTDANTKRRVKYSNILSSSNYQKWNHYCVTIRRPGNDLKVKIYLNGVLDTNPSHNGDSLTNGEVSFDGEYMNAISSGGNILKSQGNFLEAKIKDFRIYNKALTDDEIAGTMLSKSIYVNGELLVSSSLDNSNTQMSYLNVSSADIATLGEVAFSKRLNDNAPQLIRLNGTIDDFRIFNRKITSEEVALLYNNSKINMPLIQNTDGVVSNLYTSNYYLSNTNRPSNPLPRIGRDNLQLHYTFEKMSGTTILDSNFTDKPNELYLNRNLMSVSSKDSENIVLHKTYNATKSNVGGNWTFVASTNIWTTEILIGDNWTFNSSSNTWTSSRAHGLSVDDTIQFTNSGGGASGYSTSTTYHVITISSIVALKLSATNGGSELNGTTDSSGNWYAKKTPLLPHNFKKGDKIEFITNGGGATGYSTGTEYYVINVPTITTLQLSDEYNGGVVNGSSNSNGNWSAITPTTDFPFFYKKCGVFNGTSDYLETTFPSIGTNWTFNSTTDIWTTSAEHGLKLGDKIILTTNGGGATGYNTSTIYYVIGVPSITTIKLATTLLASQPLNGSANSSGNWTAKVQPIVLGDSLWTISCWINTKEVNKTQTIWTFSSDTGTTNEYKLHITPNGNKLSFMFNNSSSEKLDTGRTILPNKWYNVIVVRKISGLSEGIFIYVNGKIVGRTKISVANTVGNPSLKIGCNFSKSADFFAGKIGDFRIYDTQLNSYQIKKLYQCEETNGPLVHYTFDNSSNETVRNMGSECINLTIVGAVLDNIKKKIGLSSICFNGVNSYCKSFYPGLVGYTNNTGHPMTISLWFKKFNSTASGTLMHYGAQNKEVKIFISDTSPYNIEVKVGSVIIESLFSTLDGINTNDVDSSGEWKHLALVILPGKNYNNTIKNVRIFIDGINQTKYTTNNTLYETTVNTSDIDEIFLLGRSKTGQYFNGWIDDFRIYDTALTPSEIFELNYNIYNYKVI